MNERTLFSVLALPKTIEEETILTVSFGRVLGFQLALAFGLNSSSQSFRGREAQGFHG
jgi:hypothetical protein